MFNCYMNQEVTYREFLNKKDNFGSPMYGDVEIIKCFSYGEDVYIRDEDKSDIVQMNTYITEKEVKIKDLLNGKIVKSASRLCDIHGKYSHTESRTE